MIISGLAGAVKTRGKMEAVMKYLLPAVLVLSLILPMSAIAEESPVGVASETGVGTATSTVTTSQPTADSLKGYMENLQKAIVAKNQEQYLALARPLLSDWSRLKLAMRDDADPAMLENLQKVMPNLAAIPDAEIPKMFKIAPEQTQVNVYAATTDEIAKNEAGSIVAQEFPGGAVQAAKTLLKPAMTFYEVEFVKPGESAGIKYHLVFWDGKQWTIAGALWRAMKK